MPSDKKRILQIAKHLAHGLAFPFIARQHQWKKLGVFFSFWYVALPSTAHLFPRAEEVVAREGLPAELVQELAPHRHIRVFPDTPVGAFFASVQSGPLGLYQVGHRIANPDIGGFARPARFGRYGICKVFMRDEAYFEDSRAITAQETRHIVLLHEIRHCSAENARHKGIIREGDADYHAVRVLARETGDDTLRMRYLFNRLSTASTHTTALYLDAMYNNTPAPTAEDLASVNRDSARLTDAVVDCLEKSDAPTMDDIARCRVELRSLSTEIANNPWMVRHRQLMRGYTAWQAQESPDYQTSADGREAALRRGFKAG